MKPTTQKIRSRIPEPQAIEDMIAFAGSLEYALRRVMGALPKKRDWLDPALEREIKALLDEP